MAHSPRDLPITAMLPEKLVTRTAVTGVLMAVVFLPATMFVSLQGTSYAMGIASVSLVTMLAWAAVVIWPQMPVRQLTIDMLGMLLLLSAVPLHGVVALAITECFDFGRFFESFTLLAAMVATAALTAALLYRAPDKVVGRSLIILLGILALAGFCGVLGWSPIADPAFHRPVFIFPEPSHFVLMLAPLLLWFLVTRASVRARIIVFGVVCLFLLQVKNLTLVALIGLAAIAVLRAPILLVLSVCMVFVVEGDRDYFLDRLMMTSDTTNLSALVWLQGWQEAVISVRGTVGVGLGFQQFGVDGAKGAIATEIESLAGDFLNVLDGGSLGAKLVGEFGLLGGALVGICCYLVIRSLLNLRKMANGEAATNATIFFHGCVCAFSLDLLVRGTGYFSPSVLLFLVGLIGLRQPVEEPVLSRYMPGEQGISAS